MTKFRQEDIHNYFIDSQNNVYQCVAYIEEPHVELINISTLDRVVVEQSDSMNRFSRLIIDPRDREKETKEKEMKNEQKVSRKTHSTNKSE